MKIVNSWTVLNIAFIILKKKKNQKNSCNLDNFIMKMVLYQSHSNGWTVIKKNMLDSNPELHRLFHINLRATSKKNILISSFYLIFAWSVHKIWYKRIRRKLAATPIPNQSNKNMIKCY